MDQLDKIPDLIMRRSEEDWQMGCSNPKEISRPKGGNQTSVYQTDIREGLRSNAQRERDEEKENSEGGIVVSETEEEDQSTYASDDHGEEYRTEVGNESFTKLALAMVNALIQSKESRGSISTWVAKTGEMPLAQLSRNDVEKDQEVILYSTRSGTTGTEGKRVKAGRCYEKLGLRGGQTRIEYDRGFKLGVAENKGCKEVLGGVMQGLRR
ncbi:hypothetical protein F0562_003252 [Nyssa sinensis]|uniref:Uncharacterized protein n=1 Tax=Nyssa sinensis TaxID=561372 RepID=A0A5J5BUV4_9ASTE|nr:hypothetical protein F0562_003252 [Nyssa sinensis]